MEINEYKKEIEAMKAKISDFSLIIPKTRFSHLHFIF